jgi:hypothetical protein
LAEAKRGIIEASNPVGRPKKGEGKTPQSFVEFNGRHDKETNAKVGADAMLASRKLRLFLI